MRLQVISAMGVGLLIGIGGSRLFAPAVPPIETSEVVETKAALNRIQKSVDALREDLRSGSAAPRPATVEASRVDDRDSVDIAGEVPKLDAELAALASAVDTLLSELRIARDDPLKVNPPVARNGTRVDELIDRHRTNWKTTQDELFCWTPHQVYHVYGAPDSTTTSGAQEIEWQYRQSDRHIQLSFVFRGGLVDHLGVREMTE